MRFIYVVMFFKIACSSVIFKTILIIILNVKTETTCGIIIPVQRINQFLFRYRLLQLKMSKIQWFYCLYCDTHWLCQLHSNITIIHWENTYINPYAAASSPPPPDGDGLKCICSRKSAYCIDAQSYPPSKGAEEMALVWLLTSPSSQLILPPSVLSFQRQEINASKSKLSEHSTSTHRQHTCHYYPLCLPVPFILLYHQPNSPFLCHTG